MTNPIQGTRHHRSDPRLLGDPPQLGELDHALREPRLPGPGAGVPGLRGRGRGAERRPGSDRGGHRPADRRPSRGIVGGRTGFKPPILIGHSAGGVFTQVLLDHGFGAAGVAINSAPTEGVAIIPLSQLKSTFPVLKNPANRHRAVGFTLDQWTYAFTNTFSAEQSQETYERYHIPASGNIFWGTALANVTPGHQGNWVDYHNDKRAPLLFISGSEDHLMPPSIQKSNAKHYKSATITEIKQFDGPHLLPAQDGWESDRRLRAGLGRRPRDGDRRRQSSAATRLRRGPRRGMTGNSLDTVRLTHIGGPTVLIEVGGWRLLTDPTFDAPGRRYTFGWGSASRKATGPAITAADLGPIDAVLLSHDHHADNLDDSGRAVLPTAGRGAHHGGRLETAGAQRTWAPAMGQRPTGGGRKAHHRGDRDPLPARPAGQSADHR